MNYILVMLPAEDLPQVNYLFVNSVVSRLSKTFGSREERPGTRSPPCHPTIEAAIESLRRAMLPSPEGWQWPIRVSNPVVFAIKQYLVCLQNHSIVHFEKRLKSFVQWKARYVRLTDYQVGVSCCHQSPAIYSMVLRSKAI